MVAMTAEVVEDLALPSELLHLDFLDLITYPHKGYKI